MRSSPLALLAALGLAAAPLAAEAKVFHSRTEALEIAFPDADVVQRRTYLLDEDQVREIEARARAPVETKLVTLYTARKAGAVVGYALIEIHTVRTLPEAFLVVLSPSGEVRTLRVLAFYEPQEYLPSERWLAQFERQRLSERLALRGDIHGIAGSTLSARAVTGGVRRALAVYEVLVGRSEELAGAGP